MEVKSELRPIGALFTGGDFRAGMTMLHDLWARIPEPRPKTPNAYLVIEYGVAFALKAGDLDEAQRWADFAPEFRSTRQDVGEVEFLLGKVSFERGELEAARAHFATAKAKSKGRLLKDADERYRRLLT